MLYNGSHGSPLGLFGKRGRDAGPLNQEPTEAPGRSSIACPWKSTSCSHTSLLPPESTSTDHVPARPSLTRLRGSTTQRNLLSDRCFQLPTVIPTKWIVLNWQGGTTRLPGPPCPVASIYPPSLSIIKFSWLILFQLGDTTPWLMIILLTL